MSEMLLAARPRARVRPLFLARRWYGALSRPIANHEGIHPWGIDLIFLNALGLVLCVVLIAAAATNNDPLLVGQVTKGVKLCLRLFVAGAALPTVAWGILAFEFDRSHSRKKLLESAVIYTVLLISLILFFIAGWHLPHAFITGLQIS